MNKKLILVLILFLPAIIAGIWLLSVTGENFTASNVSSVSLSYPDGTTIDYTEEKDKEFLVDFQKKIVSIQSQEYDPDVYSLYRLDFERVQGNSTYYLCLSADAKNCLAYDEWGNWYRIDKEYAVEFLSKYNVTDVYKYSSVPVLSFTSGGESVDITANKAEWNYLLTNGTYNNVSLDDEPSEINFRVSLGDGFSFEFDVEPDWYNVEIYDGNNMVYDGLIDNVADFSYSTEATLRAVITAEWYNETTTFYNGSALYEFYLDFDIKATYSVNKDTFYPGELIYIYLQNVDNEELEITTDISSIENLNLHKISNGNLIIIPISSQTPAGEYKISINSEKTSLSVPVTINEKNFGSIEFSFPRGETAAAYNEAISLFADEIASSHETILEEIKFKDGFLMPVQAYKGSQKQYYKSFPEYGAKQNINGTLIDNESIGNHYVKSSKASSLLVRASADGVIAFSGTTTLYGNTVVIEHGLGVKTVYAHLEELNYAVGDYIKAGEIISNAKATKFAIASIECFFGVMVDGVFLNPDNFIKEPASASSADTPLVVDFLEKISF